MGRVVALVPARAGSVRLKNKNIQQIKGIPLLALAIRQAYMVKGIDEVYVSTDSEVYAEIASNYGAIVPFLRPEEISGSDSTDYDVFRHFIEWYGQKYTQYPELIIHMRPTSPIRSPKMIEKAITLINKHPEFDSLRSISEPHQSPYKMWRFLNSGEIVPVIQQNTKQFDGPTQKLPETYAQDGRIDIIRTKTILEQNSISGQKIVGYYCCDQNWDIDKISDFYKVEAMVEKQNLYTFLKNSRSFSGNLGITQGRLTQAKELQCFPINNYKKEFSLARKAGYTSIELIRDKEYNKKNPLWNQDQDIKLLKQTAILNGIGIKSICDDYIQQCKWEKLSMKQYYNLENLLIKSYELGCEMVIYPLFKEASIEDETSLKFFLLCLHNLAQLAQCLNIKIALEISWDVERLCELFRKVNEKNVGLCIDTGNLYYNHYSVKAILSEKRLHNYIYHIHLKDSTLINKNVIPGKGGVNFKEIFSMLGEIDYNGNMVTETVRGEDPYETAVNIKKLFCKEVYKLYSV